MQIFKIIFEKRQEDKTIIIMKISQTILFFILFPAFVFCNTTEQNSPDKYPDMPYVLEKQFGIGSKYFSPTDVDRDGIDEYLYVNDLRQRGDLAFNMTLYREPNEFNIFQVNFPKGEVTSTPFTFWTKNEELRILVPLSLNNKAYLCVYNAKGDSLGRYEISGGIDRNDNGIWDGGINPVAVEDFNDDGMLDVLITLHAYHDLHPRGVCAFDLKDKQKIWEFPGGAYITNAVIADITENGEPEIIMGSATVDNGSTANGTNDGQSYLLILDKNGKLISKKDWDEFTSCIVKVLDYDGDGKFELASKLSYNNLDEIEKGKITLWDSPEITVKKEFFGHFSSIEAKDLNKDGKDEIIVANRLEKRIFILGENLTLIMEKEIPIPPGKLLIEDLNADGAYEIIVSGRYKTIVFNDKLKPLAQIDLAGKLETINQGYKKPKILIIANGAFLLKPNTAYYKIRLNWFLLGMILGVLIFSLIVFGCFRALPKNRYLRLFKEILNNFDCTAILLDKKGKAVLSKGNMNDFVTEKRLRLPGSFYTKIFNRENRQFINSSIASLLKTGDFKPISKSKEVLLKDGRRFQIDIHPITSKTAKLAFILVCFQDISVKKEGERAIEWASMSQKLAHDIRNPLHTVFLTLQRLQMAYQQDKVKNIKTYDQYTNSVIEDVERLRKIADGFMKFTKQKPPDLEIISAEKLVKIIEEKTREWLPKNINFKIEAEKDLPDLYVDPDQMQQLFFNLLDNANKSMKGKGRLFLRVTTAEWINANEVNGSGRVVVFEISDTGCGIPEDKISELFKPYFSLREGGTGLGLTIARNIVEDHEGKISIRSKEGVGTTVKFELPVYHLDCSRSKI
ncbi:hypothetical protein ISS22_05150 [candidate division KSB1 bacterium]|nr:hypothetical protein [candidate division KSB1 bacterium]